MKTALEALFQAMITEGWGRQQSGDVESPAGHFARFDIRAADLDAIRYAFDGVIATYGNPATAEILGHFLVIEDSYGFVSVIRYTSEAEARAAYNVRNARYYEWFNTQPLEDEWR